MGREAPGAGSARGRECPPAVLIYDGECPVCRRAVDWIRDRARPGTLEFLSCHSDELGRRFPGIDRDACKAAAHLVLPGGGVLAGGQAAPEVLARVSGYGFAARLLRLPGAALLTRIGYRWFARRRHALAWLFYDGAERR